MVSSRLYRQLVSWSKYLCNRCVRLQFWASPLCPPARWWFAPRDRRYKRKSFTSYFGSLWHLVEFFDYFLEHHYWLITHWSSWACRCESCRERSAKVRWGTSRDDDTKEEEEEEATLLREFQRFPFTSLFKTRFGGWVMRDAARETPKSDEESVIFCSQDRDCFSSVSRSWLCPDCLNSISWMEVLYLNWSKSNFSFPTLPF